MPTDFLPGFAHRRIETEPGVAINLRVGGAGPPVLLLHGHPQNHATWRKVAPTPAKHTTVVAADLRGYGAPALPASSRPGYARYHVRHAFRDAARHAAH